MASRDKYVVCFTCRDMHLKSQRVRGDSYGDSYYLVCPKCGEPGYVSPAQAAKLPPRK